MPVEKLLEGLNDRQREGVVTTEGPVLILAGAGSGKTRVLTYRTAYLIERSGVQPYNIMAITFTNKAANEMKERISTLTGTDGVWVSTFHSACVRILRRFADKIGYDNHFTIYDSDDSKTLMKHIIKDMNLDTKKFKEKTFLNEISSAKNELINEVDYADRFAGDYAKKITSRVYLEYESRLRANNAFDFDDLIMKTVELFKTSPDVLNNYQERLHYVMVDEYQDTNTAQFELIRLLSGGRKNLCVVGDDDQSIYKFRGANIYNILNFEKHFPNAKVIKLEQNYRSTQVILDAANDVITNNKGRKNKTLWTEEKGGDKITFRQFDSAYEEAQFISFDIKSKAMGGTFSYKDDAILYRTNAQSRILEEKLMQENIPYKIIGGVNFYSRLEVKDILAYLKVIDNGADEIAVRRIINVPKRGIGATTLGKISVFAGENGMNFYEALENADKISSIGKAALKIQEFTRLINLFRMEEKSMSVPELIRLVLELTGYEAELKAENTEEAQARIENLEELYAKAVTYRDMTEEPTLSGFLEDVALVADIDSIDEDSEYVVLMTLHSAKGLEFPNVYMAGMEDGLFPGYMTITAGDDGEDMEEERRLCYVGITRAKKHLTMTAAKMRMVRGDMQYSSVSRFVKEIPEHLVDGTTYDPSISSSGRSGYSDSGDIFGGRSVKTDYGTGYTAKASYGSGYSGRSDYGSGFSETTGTGSRKKSAVKAPTYGTSIQRSNLEYNTGDRVSHRKFGEGTVTDISNGKRDYEVTVEFDSFGQKKMLASFAKLEKI
jgi:DNA helicase-2/ATP-dependent DNA helicase PcrA